MDTAIRTEEPADRGLAVARSFTEARRAARALNAYPGDRPRTLAEAYAVQDAAIGLWPDEIVGWKIGRIPDPWVERLGAGRLAGPIFGRDLLMAGEAPTDFQVIPGGFAAVEAEYVFRLGARAPAGKIDWSLDEAAEMVGSLLVGVEPAGSPLADINDYGPCVVVSDFGNNSGLILGPEVADWRDRLASLTCETWVEDRRVGHGGAMSIPGGPLEALRFLLELQAKRGRPLRAGDLVSTGAATGIHDILPGQSARIVFDGVGEIRCRAVARKAEGR